MSETIKRSRIAGCRDIYTARVTQNDEAAYVAGTPMKLARTIRMKITENWEEQKIYSDDGTEEVISSYSGTDVELEVNALAPQDRQQIFDQLYKNGYLVRSADDIQPELALGWRERRLNGLYEFHWMYCGKFGQGIEEESQTKEGSPNPQTRSLKGSFYERKKADTVDGKEKHLYQTSVDEGNLVDGNTDAKTAITKWFETVQEPKLVTV